jgi:hypothetical protein
MDQHRYRLAGFELTSEFALPLPAWPSASATAQPAVRVYRGEAPMLREPRVQRLLIQVASDEYWLEVPRVARYRVRGGSEIVVQVAAPGVSAQTVAAYLCSYALAALCCQRGLLVVHATTVACSDRAVLLLGPSGCGKSTLGAFLVARGARVLSEDLCIIDTAGGCAMAQPCAARFTLWPDCAERLGHPLNGAQQPINGVAKLAVAVGEAAVMPLPVHLVLLLREARSSARFEPLRPLEALATLAAGASLAALLQGMNRVGTHLEQCRRLLTEASAWQVVCHRSFDELPRIAQLIEQLAMHDADSAGTHAGVVRVG